MPASETNRAMRARAHLEEARERAERLAEKGRDALYEERYKAAETHLFGAMQAARTAASDQKVLEHYIDQAAGKVPYA